MDAVAKTLRNSKSARWTALAIVSFTMLCGYYLTDLMAPLKPMLQRELLWNSGEYSLFTSAYGWFNVFLGMLIFGGIILDKMGVRFTGKLATIIMVTGTVIKLWAVSTHALDGHELFGLKLQVVMASVGFAVFGVGTEVAGITISKIIVKWFQGKEMALAMGLQVATARIGTALAMATSVPIANAMHGVSKPVLVSLIMLCIGMVAFFLYATMDRKLDVSLAEEAAKTGSVNNDEVFRVKDIIEIVKNRGWWYITILCAFSYAAIMQFMKFAPDLMVNKFGMTEDSAGNITALLPVITLVFTPLLGSLYDRKGKGASIMIFGSLLLIVVHGTYSVPFLTSTPVAIAMMIVLGAAFSLVPSAMWPSVPKIIPQKQLGTAYGMIFLVQNIGFILVPLLMGWVLDTFCIIGSHVVDGIPVPIYNYTLPMIIFTCLGVLALVFSLLLKHEDSAKGYGLELPNIVN